MFDDSVKDFDKIYEKKVQIHFSINGFILVRVPSQKFKSWNDAIVGAATFYVVYKWYFQKIKLLPGKWHLFGSKWLFDRIFSGNRENFTENIEFYP